MGKEHFNRRRGVRCGSLFERRSNFGFCLSVRGGQHSGDWGESFPRKSEILKKHTYYNHVPQPTWKGHVENDIVMGSDHKGDTSAEGPG